MSKSNVRSSEYRAAGGRAWHRPKSGFRGIVFDGPQPEFKVQERFRVLDEDDQNAVDKARIRAELAQGYDESLVKVIPAGKSGIKRGKKKGKK